MAVGGDAVPGQAVADSHVFDRGFVPATLLGAVQLQGLANGRLEELLLSCPLVFLSTDNNHSTPKREMCL